MLFFRSFSSHQTSFFLAWFCCLFSGLVLSLGAYTRLQDAGLGCPDWPGCYGHLWVPHAQEAWQNVAQRFPQWHFESQKAWPEMIHRYAAGTLVLMTTILLMLQRCKWVLVIMILIIFQAMLGMWTVTYRLWPIVVMAHLIGGTLIFTLWFAKAMAQTSVQNNTFKKIAPWMQTSTMQFYVMRIALVLVFLQIMLGGWMSANQASLACLDFPYCGACTQYHWSFVFHWDGQMPTDSIKSAIHMLHRMGALGVGIGVICTALLLMSQNHLVWIKRGLCLLLLTILQILLGISNVLFQIPMAVALCHHGIAIVLFALLFYWCFERLALRHCGTSS